MNNSQSGQTNIAPGIGSFLAGLLAGGLLGAGAMLILAPQSGKKTRKLIQREGRELRDQVTDTVEDVVLPVRNNARRLMTQVRKQTQELERRGQDILDDQKEIATDVVEAEKTAVQHIVKG